jgi:ethanolamine ammonia-lyase small subunit
VNAMDDKRSPVSKGSGGRDDVWSDLRRLTAARIGLTRAGASLATRPSLEFQLAHAQARDAVHETLDVPRLASDLSGLGPPVLEVASAVADRQLYLMRPDLGRRLAPEAEATLRRHAAAYDVVFVVTDGLSARAVEMHTTPVLAAVLPLLRKDAWTIAPFVIARQGRVAIGDAIANGLGATCVVMLIGERPGLSAPYSMGAYLTWRPGDRTTDSDRNCISNIRPEGVGRQDAAFKIAHLLREMRTRRLSGVQLKDNSDHHLVGKS